MSRRRLRLVPLLLALLLIGGTTPVRAQSDTGPAPAPKETTRTDRVPAAAGTDVHGNPARTPANDEQRLLEALRNTEMPPGHVEGRVYIPDEKARVLVQPQGRLFRDAHAHWAPWIHAGLVAAAAGLMALLFLVRGGMTYERDPQGRRIKRFTAFDRFIHWANAVSFVLLALTGLNLVLGRTLVQPWLGDAAFAGLAHYAKLTHNFVGYPFLLSTLAMAVMWLQDNLIRGIDVAWFKKGGGLLSGEHVPAEKFNAGQKMIYWIGVLGGLALSATGIWLMFPFEYAGIGVMQLLQVAHSLIAGLMIAAIIGHIYLGSVGVQGSFDAMRDGTVDLRWAETHHPLWVERERQRAAAGSRSALEPGSGPRPAGAG